MVTKSFWFLLVALLFWGGCSSKRSVMTYAEANAVFNKGMSPEEVKKLYGEPTLESDFNATIQWDYIPLKEIKNAKKGTFSGFVIVFVDGRTTEIRARETVVD